MNNEIEQLVQLLYNPGTPAQVLQQAQRSLQLFQKSPQGWQLAQNLLASPNTQTQFIGAQTFIVKINEGTGLPSSQQQHADLLRWLQVSVSEHKPAFVIRKLLGAICKIYLSTATWQSCPFDVVQILGGEHELAFEFVCFLIEDSELPAAELRAKLVPEVSNLVLSLLKQSQLRTKISVRTLEVWALAFFDQFRDVLPDLIVLATQLFQSSEQELASDMFNVLGNLYAQNWRSWPPLAVKQLREALLVMTAGFQSNTGGNSVIPADYSENDTFIALVRLVIAVCQEDFETNTELHPFLSQVAAAPVPVVDDPLAVEVLEFWNQYTEELISSSLSSSDSSGPETVGNVIFGYWPRIKLYPDLQDSEWEEFASFRKDFADFVELSYPILGHRLFDQLTNVVISALEASAGRPEQVDWLSVESGLFCLNALSEIIGEDYRGVKAESQSVARIFQSDLWNMLPQCNNYRVRQTAVILIGCFVDFFLSPEGSPYMAVTLNYLFTCLDIVPLQNTASRSIQRLCDTCAGDLVAEIPAFLGIYAQIRSELQSVPHVRTVGGIACVIQALSNLEEKARAILELLELVLSATPSAAAVSAASAGAAAASGAGADVPVDPLEVQQTRLKCVAMIGKNTRTTEVLQPGGPVLKSASSSLTFWKTDPTAVLLHSRLQEVIKSGVETADVTSVEAVCDIVKAGITEGTGPFFLEEDFVISFIVAKCNAGPELAVLPVLDLARFYVMSRLASVRQRRGPAISPEEITVLVDIVRSQAHANASASLDLLTQIVGVAANLGVPFVELVPGTRDTVDIAVSALASGDRFVLRSSAAFWKELVGSSQGAVAGSSTSSSSLDPEVGEKLVRTLLAQLSGEASRSDLGPLSDVLKLLVAKHPLITSQLLKHYIVDAPATPKIAQQDPKTRADFVAQLALVKGGRKTNDLVQRFWLKCRGIPDTYDPHVQVIE